MKTLSVFVDESGDFGPYDVRCPYYLVTLVFHDQDMGIGDEIAHFETSLAEIGYAGTTIHAGPLIRREGEFFHLRIDERKKVFSRMFNFMRRVPITYTTLVVEKKHCRDSLELTAALAKCLAGYLSGRREAFSAYDKIVLYYDNGQTELTRILLTAFNMAFTNVEYRKASPSNYRLFQAADVLCTLELISLKMADKQISASETAFFKSERELRKNYLKPLLRKKT